VLESRSEGQSFGEVSAVGYGGALGLLESVYLYCPDARRLIVEVLETELVISSEYADELNARSAYGSAIHGHSIRV
jgi:hypothetical protein